MPDPPAWPTRPASARDFDLFWLVPSLPPDPFPDESYDYGSDERFGPPGTRWVFSLESLWNRQTAPGVSQISKAAIERLFRKLALKLPPAGSTSWATPYPIAPPATAVEMELGNMQRWIRTSINGLILPTFRARQGAAFDLKAFHRAALDLGSIGLDPLMASLARL